MARSQVSFLFVSGLYKNVYDQLKKFNPMRVSASSYHVPAAGSACAPAAAGPGHGARTALQHHDDLPAWTAQPAADQQQQPPAGQRAAGHRRGRLHAGPTDTVHTLNVFFIWLLCPSIFSRDRT